ncbi:MAG: class I adenylate-forming enzyme family protein, partial [Alphaproteobacteria bacterium]|nr:class I adenylate-forming enzyme family protein [Alphaproteobacteria bacterium]
MGPFPAMVSGLPEGARLVDVRTGLSLDRSEIWSQVQARASAMVAAGLERGAPVVVGHADGVALLLDLFAAWTAGSPAVVVAPNLTADERERVLATTGARLWRGSDSGETPLTADVAAVDADGAAPGATAPRFDGTLTPLGLDAPALILMTSGTSAEPKGVVHTLAALSARLTANIAAIGKGDLTRALNVLPVHFGHGLIGNCLTPLAAGGTLYLWTNPEVSELYTLAEIIDREQITFMSSVPSFWRLALRLSPSPKAAPARIHVGSAPLSVAHWRAIADWAGTDNVFNMYGMTEAANWIAGAVLDRDLAVDGLVGRPWGGALAVLTDDGSIRDTGAGEVLVQSPSMMSGYFGMAQMSQAAFHGKWLRSGDIGRIDEEGSLVLLGRIKDDINRAGIKIPAQEIDLLLERHPDVVEACAFALADQVAGEAVAAAIVLADGLGSDGTGGAGTGTEAIKAWCRARIRAEAVPSRLFVVERIPRSDRGKTARQKVRDMVLAQSVSG